MGIFLPDLEGNGERGRRGNGYSDFAGEERDFVERRSRQHLLVSPCLGDFHLQNQSPA